MSKKIDKKMGNNKKPSASKKLWKLGSKEFNTQYFDYDRDGDLIIKEGHNIYNIKYLTEKFGTSLQILMPFIIEERLEDLMDLADSVIKKTNYGGKFFYHYPMKVNQNREVVMAIVGEGAHLETSSYNDLWLIKRMLEQDKFNPDIRILCSGPKNDAYINLIDDMQHKGVKIFPLIEGPSELKMLQHSKFNVGLRLDMPVKASSYWNKQIDRFGFSAKEIYNMGPFKNLKILHYHIGSQIEKPMDILTPIKYALDVYFNLKKSNPSLDTLDIGGGMPIPYTRKKGYTVDKLMEKIFQLLKTEAEKHGMPHPNLICEWGRYVVAPAQITIFKVIDTKLIKEKKSDAKKWYVIDGSFMNDLCDTWAIGQKWALAPISNKRDDKLIDVWLAGSTCDSDDVYRGINNYVTLPEYDYSESSTDPMYIVVFDTGAYQDALSMNHCLVAHPQRIIVENGHIVLARKRSTPEEIGRNLGWNGGHK
jgi:arginine decarboxylase